MFPIQAPHYAVRLAEMWHGGQWSAFYSLLSTGRIHSAEHASELGIEARHCLRHVPKSHRKTRRAFALLLRLCDRIAAQSETESLA